MLPAFEYGTEVRIIRNVRNDGTYPGKEVGDLLIRRGAIGCVYDVGTYLQDQLVYRVHFMESGRTVGCREEELILASDEWIPNSFEFREKVTTKSSLSSGGTIIATQGQVGEIAKVVREPGRMFYHVRFGERIFQLPESLLEAAEDLPAEATAGAAKKRGGFDDDPDY
jgi:nitrogen fixation protein NifZ